jgi:chondroitin-sulfate-ABC endolyase/exolyase
MRFSTLFVALALFFSIRSAQAQAMTGAYDKTEVNDREVIAAVDFAVGTKLEELKKDGFGLELKTPKNGLPANSPVSQPESFEGELPDYIRAEKGKISISGDRAQAGMHSLRWDWVPGDKFIFNTGPLGKINVPTGYGGYSHSAFSIRIYNETVGDGALTFRWMSGDKQGAAFSFPLIFKGWQCVCYHYSWNSKLQNLNVKILERTDRIVVEAPADGKEGTLYFDLINFNSPVDFRGGREPLREIWKPFDLAGCNEPSFRSAATQEEIAAIDKLVAGTGGIGVSSNVTEQDVLSLKQKVAKKYSLKRIGDGNAIGNPIPDFTNQVSGDLVRIARLWQNSEKSSSPQIREQLEETYFLLDDFFRECGAVAQGSIGGLSWYGGRNHGDACFIMREPLKRTGRLKRIVDCLKYNWDYDSIFNIPKERQRMEMDHLGITTRYWLKIALMHETPQEIASNLRAFARRFNVDVSNQPEPDGSLYHHGAYNFSYVCYQFPLLCGQIELLSSTPFAIAPETFKKVKLAAMDMRWFCNFTEAPIFMHGRHPGRMSLNPSQYLSLAMAGRPYNGGKLDRELASAYLRFVPADVDTPIFKDANITAEPAPLGNLAMNFAALMGHRRGEWLAVVRGYGRNSWAQEEYAGANRHGFFLGNGYLDILASGNPINVVDSGCDVAHGWDWRNLDGTTTYYAPLAKIANGNGTWSERSDVGFVGGLSNGNDGIFVMPLHSKAQYDKALGDDVKGSPQGFFTAKKTYFFFDDRIICLGTGISLSGSPYPVRTTLFQKHLDIVELEKRGASIGTCREWSPKLISFMAAESDKGKPLYVNFESSSDVATALIGWDKGRGRRPILVNGEEIFQFPYQKSLSGKSYNLIMDTQDTAYYVPAGQDVKIIREHQKSRDGHDEKDTEGDYATAYFDHGINPENAEYEYVLLPKATPEKLSKFASDTSAGRTYFMLQHDSGAHIVCDVRTKSCGYVFFAGLDFPPPADSAKNIVALQVKTISGPCLMMTEELDGGIVAVNICDPDISRPTADVKVEFWGRWKLKDAAEGVALEMVSDGVSSKVSIASREGRTVRFKLIRE